VKNIVFILLFAALFLSCAEENDEELTPYQKKLISYFEEITLGFEFGDPVKVTRKWESEMKIFIGGNPDGALRTEVENVIAEINALATDGFKISITSDTLQSTSYLFFGSADDFIARYSYAAQLAANNWALTFYYFNKSDNVLTKTVSYVDTERAQDIFTRNHLLREQIAIAIGFTRNSKTFTYSIFQEAWTTTNFFSEMDRECIQLLYHPDMHPGLDEAAVEPLLAQLVKELGI
jgi:hypothetical protein